MSFSFWIEGVSVPAVSAFGLLGKVKLNALREDVQINQSVFLGTFPKGGVSGDFRNFPTIQNQ
jgi:hypothetical protein